MRFLLIPFAAGIVYSVASLLIKRAAEHGVGPWRTAFVCNLSVAILAAPFLLLGGEAPLPWREGYQPLIAGATFLVGQIFTFYAIERGALSVATPILGTKVIFVALFTVLLIGAAVPWKLWLAAFLTAGALFLFGGGNLTHASRTQFRLTALWAGLAAFNFAATDVLVQKWGPHWGGPRFGSLILLVCALFSFGMIPFFSAPLRALDAAGKKWLYGGAFFLGAQGAVLCYAISLYGHATEINVIYNFRALTTVLLVWFLGHWFGNREREAGWAVMVRRLVGAVLLLTAIGLVLA